MDEIYAQAIDTIIKAGGVGILMAVAVYYFFTENGKLKEELKEKDRALELRRRGELRRERRNNRTLMAIAELAPDPEDEEPDPDEVDEEKDP